GAIKLIDPSGLPARSVMSEAEVRDTVTRCFARVLERSSDEISFTGDFFKSFNGESLDYFVLLGDLENVFDIELSSKEGSRLSSVKDFTRYVLKHMDD
ncbi:MAG: acyl carrier protein, partial [Spirochaetales bacterium]|nr:acyl carrier protein [Spirochaetales bacterium]